MLNLLFISDSPKAQYIKSVLQPVLKVIIDVVTDFDHGLKDVFEKRPATVCIQDHIGGVTGESVARHIQMLLGNSAPTFILLYSGNERPRAIKGLYEQIIDLNQPNDSLAEEIQSTLKSLLGDQWERIYIPPKRSPASVRATVAVPEESRMDADKLVDDFLSDLETSGFSVVEEQPPVVSTRRKVTKAATVTPPSETAQAPGGGPATTESDRANSLADDLAELLVMEARKSRGDERPAAAPAPVVDEAEPVPATLPGPAPAAVTPPFPGAAEPTAPTETLSDKHPASPSAVLIPGKEKRAPASAPVPPALPPAAAEFRISQNVHQDDEPIPEDLLLAFEENYRSESRFMRRIITGVLVCVVTAAGAWGVVTYRPQLVRSMSQRFLPASDKRQAPAVLPAAIPVQKPVPPPVPQPVAAPPLPAFVPKEGHDAAYAAKNPGWERYAGKRAEFRLFSASGRLQAVQVLAVKGAAIPESLLASVLKEFAGTSEFQVTARTTKAGIRVENGRIVNKGEVVVYRKKGAVVAFVVSVTQ